MIIKLRSLINTDNNGAVVDAMVVMTGNWSHVKQISDIRLKVSSIFEYLYGLTVTHNNVYVD